MGRGVGSPPCRDPGQGVIHYRSVGVTLPRGSRVPSLTSSGGREGPECRSEGRSTLVLGKGIVDERDVNLLVQSLTLWVDSLAEYE